MNSKIQQALDLLERGFSIFPVWSPEMIRTYPPVWYTEKLLKALDVNAVAKNPVPEDDITTKHFTEQCKVPLLKWKEFQARHPTPDEVSTWFTNHPTANIAVVTGEISNLVVFDLDSSKASEFIKAKGGIPNTVRIVTGKGEHVWVRHPGFEVRPDVNKDLDLDIRGDGGYALVPPSIHGNGNQYQWVEGHSVCDLEVAPCSPWMIEYLKENATGKKKAKSTKSSKKKGSQQNSSSSNEIADIIKNGCKQGERNHTATRVAGSLIKTSADLDVAWELLCLWNKNNHPPLEEFELRGVFNSIAALEGENKKGKEEIKIDVSTFLDSREKVVSDYTEKNIVIPFAGDNLAILERKMNGGLQCGCFYILGGIPSAGKTLLTNNIVDNICLSGYPVLFLSYDDTKSEIRNRTFAHFNKQDIEGFNKKILSEGYIGQLCESDEIKRINAYKYVVQDSIPLNKWSDLIEQLSSKHKVPSVIVIDYLRKIKLPKSNSDERLRVDSILTYLTDLAKKHNVPILAISELARDSYKSGQRLSMASFKESGSIEYEASWLGILAAVEEKNGGYELKKN